MALHDGGTGTGTVDPGPEPEKTHKRWADLPRWQQNGTVALATAEVVLTAVAAVDLFRRPRAAVRGPKVLWWLALAVQPFGPVAYLARGRRR